MKPVLVTGATGFLGSHLFPLLEGARVLSRGEVPGPDCVRGDITDPAAVDRAVAGVREIYHLAGLVSRDPRDAAQMHRVHVEGTRLLCEAALRHGVERVVVSSSSGTIAVSERPQVRDESSGYSDAVSGRWSYYASKIEQEKLALDYFATRQLPVIVVNPSLLLGPGDERGSSTGDVSAFLTGQVMSLPVGGLNFVDARDCAQGLVQAMRRGKPGERYLLGAVNWTFAEFFKTLGAISGLPSPRLKSPTWLSLATAPLLRRVMPRIGRRFEVDDVSIEMSGCFWYCDSSKARRDLGFETRDPLETLRDTIEDLRKLRI